MPFVGRERCRLRQQGRGNARVVREHVQPKQAERGIVGDEDIETIDACRAVPFRKEPIVRTRSDTHRDVWLEPEARKPRARPRIEQRAEGDVLRRAIEMHRAAATEHDPRAGALPVAAVATVPGRRPVDHRAVVEARRIRQRGAGSVIAMRQAERVAIHDTRRHRARVTSERDGLAGEVVVQVELVRVANRQRGDFEIQTAGRR